MKQFFLTFLLFAYIAGVSQNKTELRLKLKKGDAFIVENKIESLTEQIIMGQKEIIKKKDFITYLFFVNANPNDSTYHIKVTYKRIRTEIENQDNVSVFDSDSIVEDSPLSYYLSTIINKSFYVEINARGEILKIDSLNNVFKLDSVNELDESSKTMLKKRFGEEMIKRISPVSKFPIKSVQEKESWKTSDTIKVNILKVYNTICTLKEITNDTYTINHTSNIFTDKNDGLNTNGIFLNYDMEGKSAGTYTLFKNSCMVKESYATQHIKGTAGMKYSESSESAFTWPIEITNIISVKTYKIEK
ncbi:MAG: DUF6263 family protein [Bacteroidales bacterium]|nr:DUF6263 family protein [Bacteroidales bacterium]